MTIARSLVISDGAAPSARERKIIFNDIFADGFVYTAVVSHDLSNPLL